jgi:prophage tail gpP-like protein
MTGFVIDAAGTAYRLPVLLSWRVTHDADGAADEFWVQCLYDADMGSLMQSITRVRLTENDETEFIGVVDECVMEVDEAGAYLTISGRGLGAVLIDNESDSKEYTLCTTEDILREHVRPWGITDIECGKTGRITGFSVSKGMSEWEILTEFLLWACGEKPRFSKEGKILICADKGSYIKLGWSSGLVSVKWDEKRYGVISEVTVKGNTSGASSTVYNSEFINRGGLCRRIIYVPNSTGYDAMRYTGEYQIDKSQEKASLVTVEVIEPLFAFAGDRVNLELTNLGLSGEYYVTESVSWADGTSCGTRLTMRPEK